MVKFKNNFKINIKEMNKVQLEYLTEIAYLIGATDNKTNENIQELSECCKELEEIEIFHLLVIFLTHCFYKHTTCHDVSYFIENNLELYYEEFEERYFEIEYK